ncbi:MAG: type II toxin-antitoxin system RelE/ParE family toxin [Magnetococcus sp. YQC-5]
MNVVISSAAKADLVDIAAFIRLHNPERALTFIDDLLDCCAALADMPHAYPLVPRYEHLGIRRYVHQHYVIFYRVTKDLVEIIHIVHGARNYDAILFNNE